MTGSSVEDLFMFDCITNFAHSFSISFWLQFMDLQILFNFASKKFSLIWITLRILLIKHLILANKSAFLATRNSSELHHTKANVFRFYEFSQMCLSGEKVLLNVIQDYLEMEAEPQSQEVTSAFEAEEELDLNDSNYEEPFLTFKTLSLVSFKTWETIYVKLKNRLASDYTLFEFLYVKTDDIWSLFELVRQGKWTFDKQDQLAQLLQKNEERRKELDLELSEDFQESEEADYENSFENAIEAENSFQNLGGIDRQQDYDESEDPQITVTEARHDDHKSGFRKFARQRKEMMGEKERGARGIMMSGLMASHLEQIEEGDESQAVIDEAESLKSVIDVDTMAEVFKPQPANFEKPDSSFIIRFKVFSIRLGPYFQIHGVSSKERKVALQILFKGEPVLSDYFDTQSQQFDSRNQTYEISSMEKSHVLDLRCQVGSEQFKAELSLQLFYDNTFERTTVALLSECKGHIYVELGLVVQSPDDEPYGAFAASDMGYAFDIDRLIDNDLVLKRPNLLQINSSKNMVDMKVEFDDALLKLGKNFRNQFLMFIDKYYQGENEVNLFKVFLFYALNSEPNDDPHSKLELIWDILTFFQDDEDKISLRTFRVFVETLLQNYFPYMNAAIAYRMADRIAVGYAGNVLQCRLLNRDFEAVLDLTDFLQSFLVQNQTYSSHRFINFLDENFFDTLQKYLFKQTRKINQKHLKFLQLSIYKNNTRQEISKLYIDLASDFSIDSETFAQNIMAEPLFVSLLGLSNPEDLHGRQAAMDLDGETVPCLLENPLPLEISNESLKLKLYLNKNQLNPLTLQSKRVFL